MTISSDGMGRGKGEGGSDGWREGWNPPGFAGKPPIGGAAGEPLGR